MRCPDGAALAAWVDGEVGGVTAMAVGLHADDCDRCRRIATAQRQVKRRTALASGPSERLRPDDSLLSLLLTLPQVEHDRALREAHQARCGTAPSAGSARLRVAVAGAGAVLLVAATWSLPTGSRLAPVEGGAGSVPTAPATAGTGSPAEPAGTGSVLPGARLDVRLVSAGDG